MLTRKRRPTLSSATYSEALARRLERPQKARKPLKRTTSLKARPPRHKAVSGSKKPKRAKLPTRKALIKRLDTLTSQIVRLRDGCCVQCGSVENLTAGHVLSRRSHSVRWDVSENGGNVWCQCWPCNFRHGSNSPIPYFQWYVRRFGQARLDILYLVWAKGRKFSNPELRAMIDHYTVKLSELST